MLNSAVVLAGGFATRLVPLSKELPKALFLVQGEPLLDHCITTLTAGGISTVLVMVHHLGEQIAAYVSKRRYPGVNVHCYMEDAPCGTGGALRDAIEMLEERLKLNSPAYVVCNVDNLLDADLKKAHLAHTTSGGLATVLGKRVPDVSQYGTIVRDPASPQVLAFAEKSGKQEPGYISSGWYIFSKGVLGLLPKEPQKYSLETQLFPMLAAKGQLFTFDCGDTPWFSVNDFKEYGDAIEKWKRA